jgi:hypothetical protein
MSRRAVIVWYVILGLVAVGTGMVCWLEWAKGDMAGVIVVALMGATTIWFVASELDDQDRLRDPYGNDSY